MAHQFLSDEWLAEVQKLAEESDGEGGFPADAKINMVVTGGPAGDRELHVSDGSFGAGLIEAPTKITLAYTLARQMFVEGNQTAAMQAFMGGQIKVEGDMTKLMAMQNSGGDPAAAAAMQAKLLEITAPD